MAQAWYRLHTVQAELGPRYHKTACYHKVKAHALSIHWGMTGQTITPNIKERPRISWKSMWSEVFRPKMGSCGPFKIG